MKKGITYRGIIAFILLSVYLVNPFKVYTPYLSYKINYNYFANVLCENKDKPQMNCNGKCYLKKQLKKTAEEESRSAKGQVKGVETEDVPLYTDIVLNPVFAFKKNIFYLYDEAFITSATQIFTPPPQV